MSHIPPLPKRGADFRLPPTWSPPPRRRDWVADALLIGSTLAAGGAFAILIWAAIWGFALAEAVLG